MNKITHYDDGSVMSIAREMGKLAQIDKELPVLKPITIKVAKMRNLLAEIDVFLSRGVFVTGESAGSSLGSLTLSCYGTRRKGEEQEGAEQVVDDLEVWLGDTEITRELSESTLDSIVSYIGENC